jgi:tetratricopeptide (TPR) repeat protein
LIVEASLAIAGLSWAFQTAIEGFVGDAGNEAIRALGRGIWREIDGPPAVDTTDPIARAVRSAHLDALDTVANDYYLAVNSEHPIGQESTKWAFVKATADLCRRQRRELKSETGTVEFSVTPLLSSALEGLLANDDALKAAEMVAAIRSFAEDAVITELASAIAPIEIPDDFHSHFRGEHSSVLGFMNGFAANIATSLRTDKRFRDALSVRFLADIRVGTLEIAEAVHKLESKFSEIGKFQDEIRNLLDLVASRIGKDLRLSYNERFALASELAKTKERLNGTNKLVSGFLESILGKRIPPEQFEVTLMKMSASLQRYDAQIREAGNGPIESPKIAYELRRARQARENGDLIKLAAILSRIAYQRSLEREQLELRAEQLHAKLDAARRTEAAAIAAEGEVRAAQLDYRAAHNLFLKAGEIVQRVDESLRFKYRIQAASYLSAFGNGSGDGDALSEAISLYRAEILNCYGENDHDEDWARAQNNLGLTLWHQGKYKSDEAILEQAIAAFDQSLSYFTKEKYRADWALVIGNRGMLRWQLSMLGQQESRLAFAELDIKGALTVHTMDAAPSLWAACHSNLGNVFFNQGAPQDDEALLERAIDAYRNALLIYSPSNQPYDWAQASSNLGAALATVSFLQNDTGGIESAVRLFKRTLLIRTRERRPHEWAQTKNNIGFALFRLARVESSTPPLAEALECYSDAAKVNRAVPIEWARTQMNMGDTFNLLLELTKEVKYGDQALSSYADALAFFNVNNSPDNWAKIEYNAGRIHLMTGEITANRSEFEKAIAKFDAVIPIAAQIGSQSLVSGCAQMRAKAVDFLSGH